MPPARTALLVALAPLSAGCVDRVITDSACGDGHLARGELCLGEGERGELTVEVLTPLSMVLADFDGDGRPDLLVMGTEPSGVVAGRLWRGNGEGGFEDPIDPSLFGCSAYPVPGPLDDDPSSDLLVDECGPSVSVFFGTTSGVFDSRVSVSTAVATKGSRFLDIDADGLREVVVMGERDTGGLALSVSERDQAGTFAVPVLSSIEGLGPDFVPNAFGLIDLDGDPFPDMLYVDGDRPDPLAAAHGEPGLRFGPLRALPVTGPRITWAGPVDLDGDGTAEVLAGSYADEALAVYDVRDGALDLRAQSSAPGRETAPIALGDLDDDGVLDLLRARPGEAKLEAFLGRRDGRFTGPTIVDIDVPVDQLALADLDDDGALDIVAGSFRESRIRVLLSDP